MSKIVYTYYDNVFDKLEGIDSQARLVELWKNNWASRGWKPVVLSKEDAKKHPNYKKYLKRFKSYKTSNHPDYELACFLRWVALANLGGGYMMDYDVFNYGFKGCDETKLTFFAKDLVPCAVYSSQQDLEKLLDLFMRYDGPTDHISDQNVIAYYANTILYDKDQFDVNCQYQCPEYLQEGNWMKYDLVHYPNFRMDPSGLQPKWKYIKLMSEIIDVFNEDRYRNNNQE